MTDLEENLRNRIMTVIENLNKENKYMPTDDEDVIYPFELVSEETKDSWFIGIMKKMITDD